MSGTHVGAVAEARGAAERSAGGETSRSAAAVAIGSAAATASAGPAGALLVPSSCSAGGSGWAFNHGRERDCSREENGASSREENRGRVARRGEQRLHQICEYMLFSLSLFSLKTLPLLFSSLFFLLPSIFAPPPIYDQPAEAPRRGSETGAQRSGHLEETGPVRARSGSLEEEARVRDCFFLRRSGEPREDSTFVCVLLLFVALRCTFNLALLTEKKESDERSCPGATLILS